MPVLGSLLSRALLLELSLAGQRRSEPSWWAAVNHNSAHSNSGQDSGRKWGRSANL